MTYQIRALMPIVHGVRDTSPPTPRKPVLEPRQGVRGRAKAANRGLNDHEQREVQAGYAKWYLDQPVPLPRKVIAAKVNLSLEIVHNIAKGRSYAQIPAMKPEKS